MITRRKFIISVIAAWLCLPGVHGGKNKQRLGQLIEQLFQDTESARAVGLSYLATYPEIAGGAVDRVHSLMTPESLARQQHDDFAHGRTVVVDGWVLARCEADLCAALVCLTHRQAQDVV